MTDRSKRVNKTQGWERLQRVKAATDYVFINVSVKPLTRRRLTALKAELGLSSQGEVIDYLVGRSKRSLAGE